MAIKLCFVLVLSILSSHSLTMCGYLLPGPVRLPVGGFTMGIKAALPRYELYLYTAVLGGALIWAGSWIFEASSGEFITC